MEEELEERDNDAEGLEEDKVKLNDTIKALKNDVEGLEDTVKKVNPYNWLLLFYNKTY